MNQLLGKVAVITGGTQGLGAAIARHFSQQGAAGVIICGRNQAKGSEIAERLNAQSETDVVFVRADLSSV
ncbi:MAG: SDR family NAD(P)-dependent oxidoreductase, partial [Serratia liquefaciens]|nr:SDR family NAD(P)-dependent oxidoreductase [Serratia liquefaciens]